ncbi:MAG: iron-containing alcohol dehydrogenase [Evtepia sp.]
MSAYYEFKLPTKILSGVEALEHIPHELNTLGAFRPLLLSDEGLEKVGTVATVQAALVQGGMTAVETFCQIPPDSSIQVVNRIAALYRQLGCDSLIAVGGGSVIDTAKGVGMVLSQAGHDLLDSAGAEVLPRGEHVPFVAVPTTAGTGSEATLVAVVNNPETKVKMEFLSYHLLPDVAVLDPRMTETLPPRITASTGFDALVHAIEAATCLQRNPVSDSFAEKAMGQLARTLPIVVRNGKDRKARMVMANGSLLAGAAFSNSMVGLVHAIGHALGGVCRVAHGDAMTILLPAVMKYNLETCRERYGELLLYLAGPEIYAETPAGQRAERAIAFLTDLRQELSDLTGLPTTLTATGKVKKSDFDAVARTALNDGAIIVNPAQADYEDILAILEEVWA